MAYDINSLLSIPKGSFPRDSRLVYSASSGGSGVTYGSTYTNIVVLLNAMVDTGADLEIVTDLVYGSYIRVKNSGRYSITAMIRENGNFTTSVGVSKNCPVASISGSPWAHASATGVEPFFLAYGSCTADAVQGTISSCSYTGYFDAGDIIRMHSTGDNWDEGRLEVSRVA